MYRERVQKVHRRYDSAGILKLRGRILDSTMAFPGRETLLAADPRSGGSLGKGRAVGGGVRARRSGKLDATRFQLDQYRSSGLERARRPTLDRPNS